MFRVDNAVTRLCYAYTVVRRCDRTADGVAWRRDVWRGGGVLGRPTLSWEGTQKGSFNLTGKYEPRAGTQAYALLNAWRLSVQTSKWSPPLVVDLA